MDGRAAVKQARSIRAESQAQARRNCAGHREGTGSCSAGTGACPLLQGSCSAGTGACPLLQGERDRHWLLRSRSQSLPRHPAQKPEPSSSRSTFDRNVFQASPDYSARDRHPQALTGSHVTVRTAREERFQGRSAPTGKIRPRAWIGSSSAPPSEDRIQPDQPRQLLLMIRPARPTLAKVPLAFDEGPRRSAANPGRGKPGGLRRRDQGAGMRML